MEERLLDALRRHGLGPAQFAILYGLGLRGPRDAMNAGAFGVSLAEELGLQPLSMGEGARALVEGLSGGILRVVSEAEIDAAVEAWWREENDWAEGSSGFRSWVDASDEGARRFAGILRDVRNGEPAAGRRDVSPFESVIVTTDREEAERFAGEGWSAPRPSGPWTLRRFEHFAEGWRIDRIDAPEPTLDDLRALDVIAEHGFTLALLRLTRAVAEYECETASSLAATAIREGKADPGGRLHRHDYRVALAEALRIHWIVRARPPHEPPDRKRLRWGSYVWSLHVPFDFTREGCARYAALDADLCAICGRPRFAGKVYEDCTVGAGRRAFFSVDREALERTMAGEPPRGHRGAACIGRTEIVEVRGFPIHPFDTIPLVHRAEFLYDGGPEPERTCEWEQALPGPDLSRREYSVLKSVSSVANDAGNVAAAAAGPWDEADLAPWTEAVASCLRRGFLRQATAEDLARDAWARRWQFRLDWPWHEESLILTAEGAAILAAARAAAGEPLDFVATVALESGWEAMISPRAEPLGFCFPAGEIRGPYEFGPVWHGPHERVERVWRLDVREPGREARGEGWA